MDHIATGSVLGNYRLDAPVGRGGFGYVFRVSAVQQLPNSQESSAGLAMKIASPLLDKEAFQTSHRPMADIPRFEAKGLYFMTGSCHCESVGQHEVADVFWDEFSLLGKLRFIGADLCPKPYDFFAGDNFCYYVMSYQDGSDLRTIIASKRIIDLDLWLGRLRDLLETLVRVKEKYYYFYHGDIKPENIIIDGSGRMRLIDPALRSNYYFGVGQTITVPYNPFILTGQEADTFAISTIIIELILGRHPYPQLDHPEFFYLSRFKGEEKIKEMGKILQISDFEKALPASIRQLLLDWLLKPVTYSTMLEKWHLLSYVMPLEKENDDGGNKANEFQTNNLSYRFPPEFGVDVLKSDGTTSEGVILDYHPEKNLVLVGYGPGERGLRIKYYAPEDLELKKPDYSGVATISKTNKPFQIGSKIFIQRQSGDIERAKVVACSTTGKYVKVVTKSKTWKWFPREILEALQRST
jgi:serine/threonine protein kinase